MVAEGVAFDPHDFTQKEFDQVKPIHLWDLSQKDGFLENGELKNDSDIWLRGTRGAQLEAQKVL